MDRKITMPESAGQCLYKYSTTVKATESLIPETNTFGFGSINHNFIRPLMAGGRSFATTTSKLVSQYARNIIRKYAQQIHVNRALTKHSGYFVLIVLASHIFC